MKKSLFPKFLLCTLLVLTVAVLSALAAEDPLTAAPGRVTAAAPGAVTAAAPQTAPDENRILSASILESKTLLEVRVHLTEEYLASRGGSATVYLFTILPYQSASKINDYEYSSMATALDSKKDVVFDIPFDNAEIMVQAKFIVAEKTDDGKTFSPVTTAAFIDNPEILAKYDAPYPEYPSKKGLANVEVLTDAMESGISHTVIQIPVNEYLHAAKTDDTYEFTFAGGKYYVDKTLLSQLDWKIGYFTDIGTNVYLDFVLTPKTAKTESALNCLYFENASPDAGYYALNTRNTDAVMYYTAFVTFMAKRYANIKGDYGFSGSFIVGYNVNSNRTCHSMGETPLSTFLDLYQTQFRITMTALRSVYANGRCYLSVADNLNTASLTPGGKSSELLDYPVAELLRLFNLKMKTGGDTDWRVALNIRPTEQKRADFWQTPLIDDSKNTPFVNLYNISALTSLLAEKDMTYEGNARKIAVTSFALPSEDDEELQAAAFAYAYYAAETEPNVESLLFARQIDEVDKDGSCFGLRAKDFSEKPIYKVFSAIDTLGADNVVSSLTGKLGVSSFSELIPDFDESLLKKKTVLADKAVAEDQIERRYKKADLIDFTEGDLASFEPSDNVEYIEPRLAQSGKKEYALYVKAAPTMAGQFVGVKKFFPLGQSIEDFAYLTLNLFVNAPGEETVDLHLLLSHGTEYTYQATAVIKANEQQTVSFSMSQLDVFKFDSFDTLRILVAGKNASSIDGFEVGNILTRSASTGDPLENFLVIAIIAVGVIIILAIVILVILRLRSANTGLVDEGAYDDEEPTLPPEGPDSLFKNTSPEPEEDTEETAPAVDETIFSAPIRPRPIEIPTEENAEETEPEKEEEPKETFTVPEIKKKKLTPEDYRAYLESIDLPEQPPVARPKQEEISVPEEIPEFKLTEDTPADTAPVRRIVYRRAKRVPPMTKPEDRDQ